MTQFESKVYKKVDDNIIGAEVIVKADDGEDIDSIKIVNKTEFDEIKAELDVLDETYVQFEEDSPWAGNTIDDLLANTEESVPINATTLSGYQSDAFSKTNHTHTKNKITDLYNYDISLNKNNVPTGESVTVTVKVTDQSGNPVSGHTVSISRNNNVVSTPTTNSSGKATYSAVHSSPGLVTFGVRNQKVQLNVVDSWQNVSSADCTIGSLKILESLKLAQWQIDTSVNIPTANTPREIGSLSTDYAPEVVVRGDVHNSNRTLVNIMPNGKIEISSPNTGTRMAQGTIIWKYKEGSQ